MKTTKKVFFVVDADGNRLDKPARPMKAVIVKKKTVTVKQKELDDLEDAIFQDDNSRVKFLNMVVKDVGSFDEYLKKLETRKMRTLAYCWKKMNWRPSTDKRKVVIFVENPYKKKAKT